MGKIAFAFFRGPKLFSKSHRRGKGQIVTFMPQYILDSIYKVSAQQPGILFPRF